MGAKGNLVVTEKQFVALFHMINDEFNLSMLDVLGNQKTARKASSEFWRYLHGILRYELSEKMIKQWAEMDKCKCVNITTGMHYEPTEDSLKNHTEEIISNEGELLFSPYFKKCNDCGIQNHITKKQYLTYQKETVESSLKECE